ncbi:MAG TPA: energy-coupling factor transporter ATPase [Bacillota bacterium]|nr:energy-coupling factor transporter ATPase [Bacillota bacterium]HPF42021.1 energy-coupling factor transporter ATPase [Bacillota bacterium]HPJ85905.1 energy-coupling factor transporter ATPase [Bacillota bacterium]HPQ61799.1 energy-coupling factor transporter ATPase [Bacillota bacterium]HRX91224.1 energy-coupling factor transporter ATPase [Candidatus Izemoplasmatales bacterium]
MSFLETKDLSFSYENDKPALDKINLKVEKGEWIAILGPNGSGKSTLAKAVVGLLETEKGTVFVDGNELNEKTVYEARQKIGIVFQNPDNQFVGVTVRDDIAFGMENLCLPREEILKRIDFFANKVGITDLLDKEPANLSGGQKQRVAITGILAMKTQVMIFDEATSMLDPYARADLMEYIRSLHNEGITIIMITHDIEEALWAERLVVMKEGRIVSDGKKEDLLKSRDMLAGAFLELPVALEISNLLGDDEEAKAVKTFLWELSSKR